MRNLFSIIVMFCYSSVKSQELVFKERNKVFLKTDNVKVLKNDKKIEKIKDSLYNKDGIVLSFKKEKVLNYAVAENWNTFLTNYNDDQSTKTELLKLENTFVNIKVDDVKLLLYPLSYSENDNLNNFFENYNIYIELEDRKSEKIKFRNYHFGLVTIPFKLYLSSNDYRVGNNFVTDANLMMYFGHRWGSTKYLKLPHKKEVDTYKHAYSISALAGISKISMDAKNTYGTAPLFEGDVASLTTGVSIAMHYRKFSGMLAYGFDFPFDYQNQWNYINKPWVGLGFGFELFKLNDGN